MPTHLDVLNVFASRRAAVVASTMLSPAFTSSDAAPDNAESIRTETEVSLETKYGLVLKLSDSVHGGPTMSIRQAFPAGQSPASPETSTSEAKSTGIQHETDERQYCYRLFPDWQTTYLFYDPSWPQNPLDEFTVGLDDIMERYPALYPFYSSWHKDFETQFERQECHLGSNAEVFPDIHDRIAWEVDGFFMSCWLGLQQHVQSVEYTPYDVAYHIHKGSMESELLKFLTSMAALIL